jgi:hypothetical protein
MTTRLQILRAELTIARAAIGIGEKIGLSPDQITQLRHKAKDKWAEHYLEERSLIGAA